MSLRPVARCLASLLITCAIATSVLAQSPLREDFANLPAGRIWYQDSGGRGEAVVFLHPGSGNARVFEKQVEPLTRAGFRFIAYDRAGQGRSTRAATRAADAAPEVEQLMDHLGIQRFHLVGAAAGGGVTLEYVLARPQRVRSIVIANSIGNVRDAEYLAMGQRIRPPAFNQLPLEMRELGPSYRAAHPDGVARWLELSRSGQTLEMGAGPPPMPPAGGAPGAGGGPNAGGVTFERLARLEVPTLLMTGDADLYTPPSVLRMFKQHMPRAELLIVPEAGHAAHWENPQVFNRALLRFLRKH